jgi:hypothetical protein
MLSFLRYDKDLRGIEKGPSRMKKAPLAVTALAASLLTALAVQSSAPEGYKSFQLVYHSDTRGYYRPCG